MKKGLLAIPVAGVVATVVALGVASIQPWSWKSTADKGEINYCLLIGQTDHNDSQARTRGIREALNTRPEHEEGSNPNVEVAKQGKLEFTMKDGSKKTFKVNELESKVCIADSGATWDQSTAINMCNTWYAKFQNRITMIVSNNDGMAEGALFSANRPDGIPIFGYDSNASTMELIKQGLIKGTINSNAPAQAAVINMLACRIKDGVYTGDENTIFNTLFKGLKVKVGSEEKGVEADENTGYVGKGYLTGIVDETPLDFYYKPESHALLVSSNIVKKENVESFAMPVEEQAKRINATNGGTEVRTFFMNTYSKTDTYLQSTMIPLVKEFRKMYKVKETNVFDGNGNDEDLILNAIETEGAPSDAYLINMTKTENAGLYIKKLQDKLKYDYKKTPIIFYNRQPFKNSKLDTEVMLPKTNGGNPYVFYVGFDAEAGADMQGQMITEWLETQVGGELIK